MKIKDILQQRRTVSFEFFPPRAAEGIPEVLQVIGQLQVFRPDFVSVTYGAGGATRRFTEEITVQVKRTTDLEVMAHLTCVGQTREEVHDVLVRLAQAGIENVIALRGDPPRGQTDFVPAAGGFAHASELIQHIRQHFPFGVAAACYPEGHPQSPNLQFDIKYTRRKVDLGADFLITQLFYDNAYFFRFMERARKAGIQVPILPGVLPILNAAQVRRFTSLCGAKIPPALDQQLDRLAGDEDAVRELGVEYATRQVQELQDWGVPGVHFYVLNRSYSVSRILKNLGLPGHGGEG
ncbi:MAG TPA: methylenetetrahydrofolate reductase [NAD(P)H] [Dehalococcoidia bacterium]|nr:methylenetetrahydrofolate reductase [NAD(P)H] [Dehalococcoidia bacterium]